MRLLQLESSASLVEDVLGRRLDELQEFVDVDANKDGVVCVQEWSRIVRLYGKVSLVLSQLSHGMQWSSPEIWVALS